MSYKVKSKIKRSWARIGLQTAGRALVTNGVQTMTLLFLLFPLLVRGGEYPPPSGYYAEAEGLLGDDLRRELHDIIDNQTNLGYDSVRIAARVLDADPENPDNLILMYSGVSVPGHLFNSSWNREHLWPQSYGADSSTKPGADFHHLYPADPGVNSSRSNLIFDWTDPGSSNSVNNAPGSTRDSNSFEPRDEDKGKVARAMLYMDLRYEASDGFGDFNLAETSSQSAKQMAKLSVLLEWHRMFPPSEAEMRRNHLIYDGFEFASYTYRQGNRNPFVDFPDLADAIFTSDSYVTLGSWRWSHFSIDQLVAGTETDLHSDPDGDGLVNLVEFAEDLDPNQSENPKLLSQFRAANISVQLRYERLSEYVKSNLWYVIEYSDKPLREASWKEIEASDVISSYVSDLGAKELVTTNVTDFGADTYYRLKISLGGEGQAETAVFDPVKSYDKTGSIFIYDLKVSGTDWKESDWMGYVADETYPWVYHYNHHWIYVKGTDDESVWIYDSGIGWYYTNASVYPYQYFSDTGKWLYYQEGTISPERWYYNKTDGWLEESAL